MFNAARQIPLPVSGHECTILQLSAVFHFDFVGAILTSRLSVLANASSTLLQASTNFPVGTDRTAEIWLSVVPGPKEYVLPNLSVIFREFGSGWDLMCPHVKMLSIACMVLLKRYVVLVLQVLRTRIGRDAISVGAQLAISDPSRTPETLLGEVIKVEKIYTFKLTMGFEVSGSLRY